MLGQVPKSPYALSEEIQKEEALKHVCSLSSYETGFDSMRLMSDTEKFQEGWQCFEILVSGAECGN